jgi:hypothetical protein
VQLTGSSGLIETARTSGTTVVLSSDVAGGIYQWRVQAFAGSVFIATSAWRTIYRRYAAPGKVAVIHKTPSSATLTWKASPDGPGDIDGYHIYRTGVLIASTSPSILTYIDNASRASACYTVTAYKGTLQSLPSASSCTSFIPSIVR